MMSPPVENLLGRVDSKFSLVTLAARRARDINSYFNQLGGGLGHMVPPQVSTTARKPLSVAFEEIAADKIEISNGRYMVQYRDQLMQLVQMEGVSVQTTGMRYRARGSSALSRLR